MPVKKALTEKHNLGRLPKDKLLKSSYWTFLGTSNSKSIVQLNHSLDYHNNFFIKKCAPIHLGAHNSIQLKTGKAQQLNSSQ